MGATARPHGADEDAPLVERVLGVWSPEDEAAGLRLLDPAIPDEAVARLVAERTPTGCHAVLQVGDAYPFLCSWSPVVGSAFCAEHADLGWCDLRLAPLRAAALDARGLCSLCGQNAADPSLGDPPVCAACRSVRHGELISAPAAVCVLCGKAEEEAGRLFGTGAVRACLVCAICRGPELQALERRGRATEERARAQHLAAIADPDDPLDDTTQERLERNARLAAGGDPLGTPAPGSPEDETPRPAHAVGSRRTVTYEQLQATFWEHLDGEKKERLSQEDLAELWVVSVKTVWRVIKDAREDGRDWPPPRPDD